MPSLRPPCGWFGARISQQGEQLAHGVGADRMTHGAQRRRQLVTALGHPLQRPLGIAARRRLDEALEVGKQARIALAQRARAAALAPYPSNRREWRIEVFEARPIVERAAR